MMTVPFQLKDRTVAVLEEIPLADEMNYQITLNGTVVCRYSEFEFAWDDLGKVVRSTSYLEALAAI